MISKNDNSGEERKITKDNNGNAKLLALILKKGKRDTSALKKAFGSEPDFPQIDVIRKTAWR